jgi:hypothetical protein
MSACRNLVVHSATKGLVVRQLRRYVSWVQSVVIQFGPYLPVYTLCCAFFCTRGTKYAGPMVYSINCYARKANLDIRS